MEYSSSEYADQESRLETDREMKSRDGNVERSRIEDVVPDNLGRQKCQR